MSDLLRALVDLKLSEPGIDRCHPELEIFDGTIEEMARWIKPAVQRLVLAERERCAKVADAEVTFCEQHNPTNKYAPGACRAIAAKIRSGE